MSVGDSDFGKSLGLDPFHDLMAGASEEPQLDELGVFQDKDLLMASASEEPKPEKLVASQENISLVTSATEEPKPEKLDDSQENMAIASEEPKSENQNISLTPSTSEEPEIPGASQENASLMPSASEEPKQEKNVLPQENISLIASEEPVPEEEEFDVSPEKKIPAAISESLPRTSVSELAQSSVSHECPACNSKVYPSEALVVDKIHYHKKCFKCSHCNQKLTLGSFAKMEGTLFCRNHFKQLFAEHGGSYNKVLESGKQAIQTRNSLIDLAELPARESVRKQELEVPRPVGSNGGDKATNDEDSTELIMSLKKRVSSLAKKTAASSSPVPQTVASSAESILRARIVELQAELGAERDRVGMLQAQDKDLSLLSSKLREKLESDRESFRQSAQQHVQQKNVEIKKLYDQFAVVCKRQKDAYDKSQARLKQAIARGKTIQKDLSSTKKHLAEANLTIDKQKREVHVLRQTLQESGGDQKVLSENFSSLNQKHAELDLLDFDQKDFLGLKDDNTMAADELDALREKFIICQELNSCSLIAKNDELHFQTVFDGDCTLSWFRCFGDKYFRIDGASGPTYRVTADDLGAAIQVRAESAQVEGFVSAAMLPAVPMDPAVLETAQLFLDKGEADFKVEPFPATMDATLNLTLSKKNVKIRDGKKTKVKENWNREMQV
eukprot:983812_1